MASPFGPRNSRASRPLLRVEAVRNRVAQLVATHFRNSRREFPPRWWRWVTFGRRAKVYIYIAYLRVYSIDVSSAGDYGELLPSAGRLFYIGLIVGFPERKRARWRKRGGWKDELVNEGGLGERTGEWTREREWTNEGDWCRMCGGVYFFKTTSAPKFDLSV